MDKKTLIHRLDVMTSVIVRLLEDRCVTCGKKLPWKKRQAGHYLPRFIIQTRWDIGNVHCQCAKCNVELGGNIPKYREYIKSRYGESMLSMYDIVNEAYKHGKLKSLSVKDMNEKYNEYLEQIRKIEKTPGELIPTSWEKI